MNMIMFIQNLGDGQRVESSRNKTGKATGSSGAEGSIKHQCDECGDLHNAMNAAISVPLKT